MTVLRWIVLISLIALGYYARVVFIPIFLSLFLAMLFEPLVSKLVDYRLRRQAATTLVVSAFVLLAGVSLWLLYLSGVSLFNDLAASPRVAALAQYFRETAAGLESSTYALFPSKASPVEPIQKVQIVSAYPNWIGALALGFGSLFEVISIAIFVPLLLFYFLFDKENLVESLNALMGPYLYLPTLNSELPNMIRAFFTANIVTALGLIATHAALFFALGFENWLPLSVVSGLLNILPIVGAPLAILAPIGMGILPGTEFPYLATIAGALVLHFIFNNLVLPVLIGSRININTASLAIGLLFWSWLWGGAGFLIAIPMTALIKIFLESNSNTIAIANLMAAQPTALLADSLEDDTEPTTRSKRTGDVLNQPESHPSL